MIIRRFQITTALSILFALIPGCMDGTTPGNSANGKLLFDLGDGINTNGGCQKCHCPDASGGCILNAPNIQGASLADINARTRDPNVKHPGGKFNFTDQDVSDIEAFLGTLLNGT
jgi:hypothetical protein